MALDVGGRFAEAERARTSGCAGMQRADGCVARVLPRRRRRRSPRSTPTSPATSRTACGTTTSSPATPAFLERAVARSSKRAIDFALDHQHATGEIEWDADPTPTTARARCSPARRASTRRCAARSRSPSGSATSVPTGSCRSARSPSPSRTGPSAFLDKERWAMDWYYPDPRRRAARPRGRRAHRGEVGHVRRRRAAACAASRTSRGSPRPRRASS